MLQIDTFSLRVKTLRILTSASVCKWFDEQAVSLEELELAWDITFHGV